MKTGTIYLSYTEYTDDELDFAGKELVEAAMKASSGAYAPYSGFRVGAAVRLESGLIVSGANVENAAFPSGICAERNAIAYSVANYPGDFPVAIAIAAETKDGFTETHVSPCGTCRQVLAEEELRTGRQLRILLSGRKGVLELHGISSLLPLQFNKDYLKIILP